LIAVFSKYMAPKKGTRQSFDHIEKRVAQLRGRKRLDMIGNKINVGKTPWNKDKKIQTNTGRTHFKKGRVVTDEEKKRLSITSSKLKHSEATKEKLRLNHLGAKNPQWKGGIYETHRQIRTSPQYAVWRKSVFERDGYKCQVCEEVGGELHAHHIREFSKHKELRFNINNGVTLCKECHKLKHKKQSADGTY
jgi:hypothetical protein